MHGGLGTFFQLGFRSSGVLLVASRLLAGRYRQRFLRVSVVPPGTGDVIPAIFTNDHLDGSPGARRSAAAFPEKTETVVAGLGEYLAADYGYRLGDSRFFPCFYEPVIAGRLVWPYFLSDQPVCLRDFDIDRFIELWILGINGTPHRKEVSK